MKRMPKPKTFRSFEAFRRFYFPKAWKKERAQKQGVIIIVRRPGV